MKGFIWLASCMLIGSYVNCQELDWKKIDGLVLNQDTVQGFENSFSKIERIGRIDSSDILFELRYYVHSYRSAPMMYQVTVSKDHTIGKYAFLWDRTGNYTIKNDVEFMGKSGGGAFYRKKLESLGTDQDVFLYSEILVDSLLNLQDQKNFVDTLRKKQAIYSRCNNRVFKECSCGDEFYLIEIKLKGQARSFRISEHAADYQYFNPTIALMQSYTRLSELITKTFMAKYFTFY